MRLGYTARASSTMLRHPREGIERVRGRIDRRGDRRDLAALGRPLSEHYAVTEDWAPALHKAIDVPWPCQEAEQFGKVWDATVSGLAAAGLRTGLASYGGWNDGDRAQAGAIWCLVAHLRPAVVVETGVAHGLTTRVILEGLQRNGSGHLSSVDLPAVDPALHHEIAIAVPAGLRSRWTYVEGTSRQQLPGLVRRLGRVDLFVPERRKTIFAGGRVVPCRGLRFPGHEASIRFELQPIVRHGQWGRGVPLERGAPLNCGRALLKSGFGCGDLGRIGLQRLQPTVVRLESVDGGSRQPGYRLGLPFPAR